MGSIIHAYEGTIEVEVERFWGWGFADWQGQDWRMLASVQRQRNRSIEPQHLVAAGSVIGESRRVVATQQGQPLVLVVSPPHLIRGSIPNDRSGNGKR